MADPLGFGCYNDFVQYISFSDSRYRYIDGLPGIIIPKETLKKEIGIAKQYFRAFDQTGKTTAIRRIAVRECGVSRHDRGPIEHLPPETSWTITALSY